MSEPKKVAEAIYLITIHTRIMNHGNSQEVIALLITAVAAIGLAGGMILASWLIGWKGQTTSIKGWPYECGILPCPLPSKVRSDFYAFGALFLIADAMLIFVFALATTIKTLSVTQKINCAISLAAVLVPMGVAIVYGGRSGKLALWKCTTPPNRSKSSTSLSETGPTTPNVV